jgi:hypothetical protein
MGYISDIQATRSTTATISSTINMVSNLSATATTIVLTSATNFAASGIVLIDNEVISYASKTATNLVGCVRGINGTTAATHTNGTTVTQLTLIIESSIRLKGISVSGTGSDGLINLSSNNGISIVKLDVPANQILTLNIPEDGIVFPKGIYTLASSNVTAYTVFTDKYSGPGLTAN